jgi:NitT/TauT family transport system permease protein
MAPPNLPISAEVPGWRLNRWDVLAILLVVSAFVLLAETSLKLIQPLPEPGAISITLDPGELPGYAARTTLRMVAAMVLSLAFTFTYATWAAKSRRAELILIPILDVLQSVPILGFISVTVVFFMSLAPGLMLGAELAAVFAIFTSQAWNMAFSFYQSLRTVPEELREVSNSLRFSPWLRFWRLEVPFAMPALIWNMMMSASGGWFFVVAAEAISVGTTAVKLPGIGSYIALAIENRNLEAIGWAIATMLVVILIYDQLLFRPLIAWSDRFRYEQEAPAARHRSWVLTMLRRSRLVKMATAPFGALWRWSFRLLRRRDRPRQYTTGHGLQRLIDWVWFAGIAAVAFLSVWKIADFVFSSVSPGEAVTAVASGLATLGRVFILIGLASIIWVPVGVWIGLRPEMTRFAQPAAQFLAAFPANLLFPVAVVGIVTLRLDPNIWLSPLMILGTQWYILFNVIAGASTIPGELRDISANLRIRGWLWWSRVALPAVFPFYVTGAITASGGAWNASIVAELVSWGNVELEATGLGSYIAKATAEGDFHRIMLGITVMSAYVLAINRAFWRPLYRYAERRYKLG